MFFPLISFLNTGYLTYLHKNEVYQNKKSINETISIILTVLAILSLSMFIEYGMGKLFQVFIIILGFCLIDSRTQQFQDRLFYFLGVVLIIGLYLFRNIYLRIFFLTLIIAVILTLELLKKYNQSKFQKYNSNLQLFLKAIILITVLLSWSEYGKEPKIKYIKLWQRK
jgi:hypothetical protein